jgi:hypothetical protein
MNTRTKLIITGILGAICGIAEIASGGQTGVGWFVFGIVVIWGLI